MKVMNKSLLKKRRVMGFTAGLTASASRTASLNGGGLASIRSSLSSSAAPAVLAVGAVGAGGSGPADHWANVQREIAIQKKLQHPNIVRLYEVMDDPSTDNLYLIMEHMSFGCLMSGELDKLQAMPLDRCWGYLRDIVLGLEYLHFQKVVHRVSAHIRRAAPACIHAAEEKMNAERSLIAPCLLCNAHRISSPRTCFSLQTVM